MKLKEAVLTAAIMINVDVKCVIVSWHDCVLSNDEQCEVKCYDLMDLLC